MTTLWHDLDLADGRDRSAMRRGSSATARGGGRPNPSGLTPAHRGLDDLAGGWSCSYRGQFQNPRQARAGGGLSLRFTAASRHRGLTQFLTTALVVGAVITGLMVCFTLGQDRTDNWCRHQADRASIATCQGRP